MNKKDFSLNELMMVQGVSRWHMVEMSRTQSVAEHSFNVAQIAGHAATLLGFEPHKIAGAMVAGLWHDADEIHTGDAPSPTKPKPDMRMIDTVARIIKMADYIEAAWFAKHYAIGPRAQWVKDDTMKRVHDKMMELPYDEEKRVWAAIREELLHE
tara:strand:- start:3269 stop:3733 length:465 start_codon:yes stop_codon:yes gene_type:complete